MTLVSRKNLYPFSAIVGQEELKLGLLIQAVDPSVGGLLIRGGKGSGKSTAVRALSELLPKIDIVKNCPYRGGPDHTCDHCTDSNMSVVEQEQVEVVEIPLGSTEDRVVGSIDIGRAIKEGEKKFEPGILASANRQLLYVDEVNLLSDHLVDVILDAAATGINQIEREGISIVHPSKFSLIGSMNPEEGELRPQILDRFGLHINVNPIMDWKKRKEVLRRLQEFDRNPDLFRVTYGERQELLRRRIQMARDILYRNGGVLVPPTMREIMVKLSLGLDPYQSNPDFTDPETAENWGASFDPLSKLTGKSGLPVGENAERKEEIRVISPSKALNIRPMTPQSLNRLQVEGKSPFFDADADSNSETAPPGLERPSIEKTIPQSSSKTEKTEFRDKSVPTRKGPPPIGKNEKLFSRFSLNSKVEEPKPAKRRSRPFSEPKEKIDPRPSLPPLPVEEEKENTSEKDEKNAESASNPSGTSSEPGTGSVRPSEAEYYKAFRPEVRATSHRVDITLFRCAKAIAALEGRDEVILDDVFRASELVIVHRKRGGSEEPEFGNLEDGSVAVMDMEPTDLHVPIPRRPDEYFADDKGEDDSEMDGTSGRDDLKVANMIHPTDIGLDGKMVAPGESLSSNWNLGGNQYLSVNDFMLAEDGKNEEDERTRVAEIKQGDRHTPAEAEIGHYSAGPMEVYPSTDDVATDIPNAPGRAPPVRGKLPHRWIERVIFSVRGKMMSSSKVSDKVGRRAKVRSELAVRGRYVHNKTPKEKPHSLAFDATVRAAAIHQKRRREEFLRKKEKHPLQKSNQFIIENADVREKVFEYRAPLTILFVLDASESMLQHFSAMREIIKNLHGTATQRRDRIGLIALQGFNARIFQYPTMSLETALNSLSNITPGSWTPLADGLQTALDLFHQERLRDPKCLTTLVLLTDGGANIPRIEFDKDGRRIGKSVNPWMPGGVYRKLENEILDIAAKFSKNNHDVYVVYPETTSSRLLTGNRYRRVAENIARAAGGTFIPVKEELSEAIISTLQTQRMRKKGIRKAAI